MDPTAQVTPLLYLTAWSPVLVVLLAALVFKRSALELSIIGLLYTFLLCGPIMGTPPSVLARASADGVLATLPLLLVIFFGIALSNVCLAKGGLQRIVAWFSAMVKDEWRRMGLLTMGVGNFVEGAGVIAETVLAPMIRVCGVSPTHAAALSIISYSGLLTLALAGVVVKVLATVTGLPLDELSLTVAWLSVLTTVGLAVSIPWFVGDARDVVKKLWIFLPLGLAASLATLAAVRWVGMPVAVMLGGLFVIALFVVGAKGGEKPSRELMRDFAPFLVIVAGLSIVSLVPTLRQLTRDSLAFKLAAVPTREIVLRPLFDGYTYIFLALVLALALYDFAPGERLKLARASAGKAWRPVAAMALFGAMGQLVTFSGYSPDFASVAADRNLASILARGTYHWSGSWFPLFVPLLGWAGTFLTGYGVASILLFGKFQVAAAGLLDVSPVLLASALAVGASVGGVSSPFKISLATPLTGAVGRESEVLPRMIFLGVTVCLLLGVCVWCIG